MALDKQSLMNEVLATTLLIFAISQHANDATTLGVAFAVLTFLTGANMNPAVSFAQFLSRKCSEPARLLSDVVGQLAGSILGCFFFLLAHTFDDGTEVPNNTVHGKVAHAFIAELLVTCIVALVVLGSDKADANFRALFIGMAYYLAGSMLHSNTGCSMNPARTFGPALMNTFHNESKGQWDDHWIWWVGPLCGGALAAGMHALKGNNSSSPKAAPRAQAEGF